MRVDQSALNKNLEIIAKALERITELSNSYQTCEEELNALKQRTGRTERDIHTINKGMELRKQFDLNKIIEAVEEQEGRLQKVETSASQHSNEITKLYDMAKYLDCTASLTQTIISFAASTTCSTSPGGRTLTKPSAAYPESCRKRARARWMWISVLVK